MAKQKHVKKTGVPRYPPRFRILRSQNLKKGGLKHNRRIDASPTVSSAEFASTKRTRLIACLNTLA